MRKSLRRLVLCMTMILVLSSFGISYADAPDSWALEGIEALRAKGILSESMFSGFKTPTTREQFAYLGVKLYEYYTGKEATALGEIFSDTSNEYVLKARALGIVGGYSDGTFKPGRAIRRDELAALFVNVFKASGINYKQYSGEKFTDDAEIASWAKASVYIAKANGIISGVGGNYFSATNNATVQQSLLMFNNGTAVQSVKATIDVAQNKGDIYISKLDKVAEYVVITNQGKVAVDLTGWRIRSVRGDQNYTFGAYILEANQSVVVGDSQRGNAVDLHWMEGKGVWNNSESDPAELYDRTGVLVDTFND